MKLNTYFASAERDDITEIDRQRKQIREKYFIMKILDTIPTTVMVLNNKRQAIYCNRSLIEFLGIQEEDTLSGLRPGEILHCVNSHLEEGGCGTSKFCQYCEAVHTILESFEGKPVTKECKINIETGSNHEHLILKVTAVPLIVDESSYICLSIDNISNEKKLNILEHIFIHDISNTVTIVQCITDLLQFAEGHFEIEELLGNLAKTTQQLTDEINTHRQLLLAENNELIPCISSINSTVELLEELKMSFKIHDLCRDKNILIAKNSVYIEFYSDPTILKRVLHNMIKNALEATAKGDSITIGSNYEEHHRIRFFVRNNQVMSEEVKANIFKYSFSTKGENRGIGTYSIRLLTEKYLRGQVNFISDEEHGTVFYISIPLKINGATGLSEEPDKT